ncbi:MAG: sensor histidine kinase [Negativicutes bacterium]|nr:sensor histidine kinase [Negativicutes bacterium]
MKRIKLQYKIALLSIVMICFALLTAGILVLKTVAEYVQASTGNRALAIAQVVALSPTIQEALLSDNPSAVIQPFAENWRKSTGAAFIIVANMQQIRLSYPIPSMIGTSMAPLYRDPVLRGEEFVYVAQGNLAPTIRANVPIFNSDNTNQLGFVSVGFYLDEVKAVTRQAAAPLLGALLLAMCVSIAGAALLAKNVKQATFGLEPHEIGTLLKEQEATLTAIHEGVIAVDTQLGIRLMNHEASKILGADIEEWRGRSVDAILPQNKLRQVIDSGQAIYNEEQVVVGAIIMSNSVPIILDDKVVGAVISFRDRTEVTRLAEELTGVHRFVDAMRAQTHEFKNKLHTISGLIQLKRYEEAVNFAIDSHVNQQGLIGQLSVKIKDSIIYGLLLGKASQMKELGINFIIEPETNLQELPVNVSSGDLVLIIGNLLQNAIEAVEGQENKCISILLNQNIDTLLVRVYNSGPWIEPQLGGSIYKRGISTKRSGSGLGLALVSEKLAVVGGTIFYRNIADGGVEFEISIPYAQVTVNGKHQSANC